MDIRQTAFSLAMMGISAIAAYFIFRRGVRQKLVSRAPLFVVCFLLFFYLGFVNLPLAVPDMFKLVIGHSVWTEYMPPAKLNVTVVGGTWWVVRWLEPIREVYFYIVLGGMLWALVNLFRRSSPKLNSATLICGVLLFLISFVMSIACFPFCL